MVWKYGDLCVVGLPVVERGVRPVFPVLRDGNGESGCSMDFRTMLVHGCIYRFVFLGETRLAVGWTFCRRAASDCHGVRSDSETSDYRVRQDFRRYSKYTWRCSFQQSCGHFKDVTKRSIWFLFSRAPKFVFTKIQVRHILRLVR